MIDQSETLAINRAEISERFRALFIVLHHGLDYYDITILTKCWHVFLLPFPLQQESRILHDREVRLREREKMVAEQEEEAEKYIKQEVQRRLNAFQQVTQNQILLFSLKRLGDLKVINNCQGLRQEFATRCQKIYNFLFCKGHHNILKNNHEHNVPINRIYITLKYCIQL